MPGSSLWLVPSPSSPLCKTLTTLIHTTIPSLYPPEAKPTPFDPHVTLTADTVPNAYGSSPQEWLNGIALPVNSGNLEVKIKEAQVGEVFFRKLTLRCEKSAELCDLAAACRKAGTGASGEEVREWVEKVYAPHASLMYSDLPSEDMKARLDSVNQAIQDATKGNPDACEAKGAEIWLVPTSAKPLTEWQPIARRKLDDVVWKWVS